MVDEKDNFLYVPDLHPERNYRSDAVIPKDEVTNPTPPTEPDIVDELITDFEEVKSVIKTAPVDIHPIALTIDKLIKRIQVAFPYGYDSKDTTKKDVVDIDDVDPEKVNIKNIATDIAEIERKNSGLPALFPKPTNIAIKVVKPRSIVNIAVDRYKKDTVDLQKYYLNQLRCALQNYFHQVLMVMAETNIGDVDKLTTNFDGNAVKIPAGQNLEHLRDYIVRSQIIRNQKSRLFKKTHNVDQTVMHLRAWHAAEKERERYYMEKYGDSGTYLDSESNALLRESRSTYDNAYSQSLYDMYKYLNSSVIVISDILDMSLKESKAKGKLLKAGVNIFAVTQKHSTTAVASRNNGDAALKESIDKSKNSASTSTQSKTVEAMDASANSGA